MTLTEMAEMFQITPNYLKNQWTAVVKSKMKQGIELIKLGRGDSAEYGYKTVKDDFYIFEFNKKD